MSCQIKTNYKNQKQKNKKSAMETKIWIKIN